MTEGRNPDPASDSTAALPPHAPGKDRHFVAALARGLRILRCFSAERPTLGTSEIARLTGLPQPTVWRACHTLLETGYLVPDGDSGRMRLGAGCLALGHAVLATQPMTQVAQGLMQRLANRFTSALALAERDGDAMIVTMRVQGPSTMLMNIPVGSRMPILSSALGWAYLAELAEAPRAALIEMLRHDEAERWDQLGPAIDAAMTQYRNHGYLVNRGYFHPRVASCGVAFRLPGATPEQSRIYALNCGGPAAQFNDALITNEIAPALIEMTQSLRAALPHPRKDTT
ncbi:IclR family transcriptional regulator [Pseudooceanicola sp.]|uniref:IclR family transcriptional regulator n=1 Tax=Pseudooceanicola sp. TaxID=1914328 RepID=UPI002619C2ED|nr:IclR family transcriptional regulator [Pseudooceanicola sp.]MDF1855309.1 IclR family transcriptional regulator [Pseudooceanicola sp.]